jgi:hypothetical protein
LVAEFGYNLSGQKLGGVADGLSNCNTSPVAAWAAPGCELSRVAYRTEHT